MDDPGKIYWDGPPWLTGEVELPGEDAVTGQAEAKAEPVLEPEPEPEVKKKKRRRRSKKRKPGTKEMKW